MEIYKVKSSFLPVNDSYLIKKDGEYIYFGDQNDWYLLSKENDLIGINITEFYLENQKDFLLESIPLTNLLTHKSENLRNYIKNPYPINLIFSFLNFELKDTLVYYDGPLFSIVNVKSNSNFNLAFEYAIEDYKYLVIPTTSEIITQLEKNKIGMTEAFFASDIEDIYIINYRKTFYFTSNWYVKTSIFKIPKNYFPPPNTSIHSDSDLDYNLESN